MTRDEKESLLPGYSQPSGWEKFKAQFTPKTVTVLIYAFLYVVSGVINSIFLKKVMNNFQNYPFFLGQVTNYIYIPVFGIVVVYEVFFTKLITPDQRRFPNLKFAIMGAIDALNGYFVIIGGIFTSGPMQQLLTQAVIPVTMIGSFLYLREKYSKIQIVGSMIIVAGVVLSIMGNLTGSDNSGNRFIFNMIFLLQAIPFAASNLYKDVAFKSVDMDVWYLQFWDVVWQSLAGTILFPINFIVPPPAKVIPDQILGSMKNGTLCLAGQNLVVPPNCTDIVPCDNCEGSWWILCIYICVNVIYNVFILLVIKHGSATILSIAQTLRLPITTIAFSIHFIMGDDAVPLTMWVWLGLGTIIAGLTTYRYGSLRRAAAVAEEGDDGTNAPSQRILPRMVPGGADLFVETVRAVPRIQPKTPFQQRESYINRLGINHPRHTLIQ